MPEPCTPIRRQPLNSLSTKIIFFVFLSTFLTALAVSWISIESTYKFLRRRIDQTFPAVLDRSVQRIETWLDQRRAEVGSLAESVERRLAVPSEPGAGRSVLGAHAREAFAVLGSSQASRPLALLERSGAEIETLAGWPALPDDARRVLAATESPRLLAVSLPDGSIAIVAAAPIRGAGGEPISTLAAAFDARGLAALLAADPAASGPRLHLVGLDRRTIASTDGALLGELLALPPASASPVGEYAGPGGERLIGAARSVGDSHGVHGWTLVVEEPFDRAFEPVLSVVTRVFVTDLGIVFLFSFLAYQITAAIVKPIEALSEGARRVSQGELDLEIPDTRGSDEIGLLTRTFNDMMRKLRKNQLEIESANHQLKDQNQALQRANEVLSQLSITDGLTKLHNHRFFQDHLTREIKRVQRTGEPLSMLLVDIDDFKRLNDRLGHAAGDELLVRIARIMNETMRESDLLARYGGEEFVVLASGTDLRGAATLGEKVRESVGGSTFLLDDSHRLERITVSVGVAQYKGDRKGFFHGADRSLYRAKAAGKNCVRVDEGTAETGASPGPWTQADRRAMLRRVTRIVGLTGGIGSGKTTVARQLAALGAVVVDADAIVHALQARGQPLLAEIAAAFGADVLDAHGELDRARLADRVFRDPQQRLRLNALVHPRVGVEMARRVEAARAAGAPVVVLDVPLLLEGARSGGGSSARAGVEAVIVVFVPEAVQVERTVARDGCTREDALRRVRAQMPLTEKRALADHVIDNGGTPEETARQVRALWEQLCAGDAGRPGSAP